MAKKVIGLFILMILLVEISFSLAQEIPRLSVTKEDFQKDAYTFGDISIEEDIIKIDVSYSGGCEKHDFDLIWSGDFMESLPVQVSIYLSHDSKGDACEALIMKTLQFDLTPLKESYQNTYEETGNVVINFYDSDNNKHQVIYNVVGEEPITGCQEDAKLCPDGTVVGRVLPDCNFEPCPNIGCQEDAKLCPDGTVVGRVPPGCEFEPCPNIGCTEDAKLCPDGTVVGRIPPGCEFEECPKVNTGCQEDAKLCPDRTVVSRIPPGCEFAPCPTKEECDVIGLRHEGKHCSIDKGWVEQKKAGSFCENSFECKSNVCVDDECISGGLLRRILDWFKKLFGGD